MASKGKFVPLDTLVTNTYYVLVNPVVNRPAEFNLKPKQKHPRTFTFASEIRLTLKKMENIKIKGELRTMHKADPKMGTEAGYTSVPSAQKDTRESDERLIVVIPAGARVEYFGVDQHSATLCFVPNVRAGGKLCQLNVFADGTFGIRAY